MSIVEQILLDCRQGLRALAMRRGATTLTIAALALAVGVSAAVFSIVNGVLLQPLPYRDAEQLVMVWGVSPEQGFDLDQRRVVGGSLSVLEFLEWQEKSGVFDSVVAFNSFLSTVTDTDDPEGVFGYGSTPGLFQMLGVEPFLGRGFLPEEEQPGAERVMVLMYDFWRRRFRADPSIIGKQIETSGRPARVVGVMPPGFVFFNRQVDLLLPYPLDPGWLGSSRNQRFWRVMGRIKQGLSLEQAQAQADVFSAQLAQQYPESNEGWRVQLVPVAEESAGRLWPAMKALLGAIGFLLLIACSNVANLRLVQASARAKELALRSALGAGRRRLLRQLMIESLTLGIAGGVAGLGIAWVAIRYFQTMLPDRYTFAKYMVQAEAVRMDLWVVGFAVAVSLAAPLIFGLLPAWKASRPDLAETLKDVGKGSAGGRKGRAIRDALVVASVALAVVITTGAGLIVRSFTKLYEQGAGIRYDNILTLYVAAPFDDIREQVNREQLPQSEAMARFQAASESRRDRILAALTNEPGVESVSAGALPLEAWHSMSEFHIEGRIDEFDDSPPLAVYQTVTPNYFEQLGIPLRQGRLFDDSDGRGRPDVAVISQELANRYFADQDPIGRRIGMGRPRAASDAQALYAIVGVVGDVRMDGMNRPAPPIFYRSMLQRGASFRSYVMVKTRTDPASMTARLRAAARNAVPGTSADRVRTLEAMVRDSIYEIHYSMLLMSGLASLSLVLAVVGVYGVLSFSVKERTREIGVRIALGAEPSQILRLVVKQGVGLAVWGVLLGLAAALVLTRFLSTLLFAVEPIDPVTFLGVAVLLIAAAALASYVPARRAAGVDPIEALRYE